MPATGPFGPDHSQARERNDYTEQTQDKAHDLTSNYRTLNLTAFTRPDTVRKRCRRYQTTQPTIPATASTKIEAAMTVSMGNPSNSL